MPIFRRHDDAPRERTPEERERARAERAARRASRSGGAEPPPPAFADEAFEDESPEITDLRPPRERDPSPPEPDDAPLPRYDDEPSDDFAFPDPPPLQAGDPPPLPGSEEESHVEALHGDEPSAAAPPPHDLAEEEPQPVEEPPLAPWESAAGPAPADEPAPLQPTAPFDPLTDDTSEGLRVEADDLAAEGPLVADDLAAEGRLGADDLAAEGPLGADDLAAEGPRVEDADPVAEEPRGGAQADTGDFAVEEEPHVETVDFAAGEAAERPPIVPPAARRARSGRAAPAPLPADGERPVPPKRITAGERRLPPTPPPPGTPAFSKRRRRRGRILATLVLLLFAAFLFGLNSLFQPFKGDGGETVTVRIPAGSSVADVGDLLAESEVVDSSLLFVIRARIAGADLKAGTYQLKRDSSYGDTLDALADDPAAPRTIKVVIPEGRSRQETAPIVKEAGLTGSYLSASDTQKGFKPSRYGAPRNTKTLEGFLFPATYELKPAAKSTLLVEQQLEAFEQNIAEVDMKRARRRNLSVYDVLIIASMVEREATLAKERPIIAAVIHNRLRSGEPLGIDATIRYAVRNWSEPLKESELNIDSPYNTRRRAGLPPTPIGSPGLDSIRAAANPANVPFKYYVVKPGGDGAHNFSTTIEEFEEDVAEYNRERERRGGKSPASSG